MCFDYPMQEKRKVVSIDSYENVSANDEKALQKAVANQPVSVAINADTPAFQHYTSVSIWTKKKEHRITAPQFDLMSELFFPIVHAHRASSTGCAG